MRYISYQELDQVRTIIEQSQVVQMLMNVPMVGDQFWEQSIQQALTVLQDRLKQLDDQ